MIYLTLAIVSSMAVAVVMRLSEKRIRNNISMLASNYLMCSVLAGLYAGGLWGGFAQEGIGFAAGWAWSAARSICLASCSTSGTSASTA